MSGFSYQQALFRGAPVKKNTLYKICTWLEILTDDEELDPLVFDNLEVNRRAEVAHVDPAGPSLNRILRPARIIFGQRLNKLGEGDTGK